MPDTPRIRSLRNRFLVFSTTYRCCSSRIQPVDRRTLITNKQNPRISIYLYRVYLHYHTVAQVVAGAFVGTALGCVWYYFVNYYFTKYVPFIIEHPFEKYLLIRDYAPIPRLIHFQYEDEYAEAK